MKRVSHDIFLKKLVKKSKGYRNGEFEVVGEFVNTTTKILCKNKYGECLVNPLELFRINYFTIRSAVNKTTYWINKAKEVHNNKYIYTKVKFTKSKDKTIITCPIHGDFEQRLDTHLSGHGCSACDNKGGNCKFNVWKEKCPGNPGIFYILRCKDKYEEFYKVGITCRSVKERYNSFKYNYEIVKQIVDDDRERIWNLEKTYLSLLKDYKYEPRIKFDGSAKECFKLI